jgi:hypothetical protein
MNLQPASRISAGLTDAPVSLYGPHPNRRSCAPGRRNPGGQLDRRPKDPERIEYYRATCIRHALSFWVRQLVSSTRWFENGWPSHSTASELHSRPCLRTELAGMFKPLALRRRIRARPSR